MLSVIIPTIDRELDLMKTLRSITLQVLIPEEIIIVDQNKTKSAEIVANDYTDRLNIKYIYTDQISASFARNLGIENSHGDIICFLDDDVFLDKDYFKNIAAFFKRYPDALGVQGVITNFEQGHLNKLGGHKLKLTLYNLFATVFLLNRGGNVNRFLPSARNVYCKYAIATINCQWLSGCSAYRKKVFGEYENSFDTNMIKYCYGEDKLFSYQLYKKFPNSLYIDPSIQYEHYPQLDGRLAKKALIETRILYNYYIWHKVICKTLKNKILFLWSSFGDLILYLVKGRSWFKIAIQVYADIWFKSKKNVFEKYRSKFNFSA